jgi:hypothetical protein
MSRLQKLMAAGGWNERKRVTQPRRNTLFSRAAALLNANEVRAVLNHSHILTENQKRDLEHRAGYLRSLDGYMRNYYRRQERERQARAQKKRWLAIKYGERWLKKKTSRVNKK